MSSTELAINETIEIDPPKPEPPRKPYLCRHIFVDGHQCGSRSLRGQNFCYYHQTHRTSVLINQRRRQPKSGFDLTRMDGLDNHTAIQLSLSEVLGRIASNEIDSKSAWLLLYGLQIASQNLRRSRPNPEAPIPDTIVEDATFGQLAEPEHGRPTPPSLLDRMRTLLEEDPNADLGSPEVQTQLLQNETLDLKDRGCPFCNAKTVATCTPPKSTNPPHSAPASATSQLPTPSPPLSSRQTPSSSSPWSRAASPSSSPI